MKLTALNWKILAIVAGLTLSASLTACAPTPSAPDATKQGDAMKSDGKGDAMKGDAMKGDGKGDAMKGDAMKSNEKKTPTTKP
jgi:pentapeptide MXKDX repeat protein